MHFFELEAAASGKAARSVTALGPRGYEVRWGRTLRLSGARGG